MKPNNGSSSIWKTRFLFVYLELHKAFQRTNKFQLSLPWSLQNQTSHIMHIKIISIDGGRTSGDFPASIPQRLENDFHQRVTNLFDVIFGSATNGISTDAIIVDLPLEQILNTYSSQA